MTTKTTLRLRNMVMIIAVLMANIKPIMTTYSLDYT